MVDSQPEFHPVKSSNIAAIAHHDGALHVKFNSGEVWKYRDVPADLHATLKGSPSVGKAFHALVKGKFAGEKVM